MSSPMTWHAGIAIRQPELVSGAVTTAKLGANTTPTLQAWLGNKLIGWFSPEAYPLIRLPNGEHLNLETCRTKRSARIARYDALMLGEYVAKHHNIPKYAVQHQDLMGDAITYEWDIYNLTLETYAQLFDLDGFVPC